MFPIDHFGFGWINNSYADQQNCTDQPVDPLTTTPTVPAVAEIEDDRVQRAVSDVFSDPFYLGDSSSVAISSDSFSLIRKRGQEADVAESGDYKKRRAPQTEDPQDPFLNYFHASLQEITPQDNEVSNGDPYRFLTDCSRSNGGYFDVTGPTDSLIDATIALTPAAVDCPVAAPASDSSDKIREVFFHKLKEKGFLFCPDQPLISLDATKDSAEFGEKIQALYERAKQGKLRDIDNAIEMACLDDSIDRVLKELNAFGWKLHIDFCKQIERLKTELNHQDITDKVIKRKVKEVVEGHKQSVKEIFSSTLAKIGFNFSPNRNPLLSAIRGKTDMDLSAFESEIESLYNRAKKGTLFQAEKSIKMAYSTYLKQMIDRVLEESQTDKGVCAEEFKQGIEELITRLAKKAVTLKLIKNEIAKFVENQKESVSREILLATEKKNTVISVLKQLDAYNLYAKNKSLHKEIEALNTDLAKSHGVTAASIQIAVSGIVEKYQS